MVPHTRKNKAARKKATKSVVSPSSSSDNGPPRAASQVCPSLIGEHSTISNKSQTPTVIISAIAVMISTAALVVSTVQLRSNTLDQRLSRRAWIGPIHYSKSDPVVGMPIVLTVDLQNFGTTPARHLDHQVFTSIMGPQEWPTFLFRLDPGPAAKEQRQTLDLYPSAHYVLSPGHDAGTYLLNIYDSEALMNWGPHLIGNLRTGQVRMYLWGRVWYDDIYDHAHHTDFCVFFQYESYTPCGRGNGSDADLQ